MDWGGGWAVTDGCTGGWASGRHFAGRGPAPPGAGLAGEAAAPPTASGGNKRRVGYHPAPRCWQVGDLPHGSRLTTNVQATSRARALASSTDKVQAGAR